MKYVFIVAFFLQIFSSNINSQTLQSELENQNRKLAIEGQMQKESIEEWRKEREVLLSLPAYQCAFGEFADFYDAYYFFNKGIVFEGLHGSINRPFDFRKFARIDAYAKYIVKGEIVSWEHYGRNNSGDDSYELHLKTLKFYSKDLNTGKLREGNCRIRKF